jgi:hypothetical protein
MVPRMVKILLALGAVLALIVGVVLAAYAAPDSTFGRALLGLIGGRAPSFVISGTLEAMPADLAVHSCGSSEIGGCGAADGEFSCMAGEGGCGGGETAARSASPTDSMSDRDSEGRPAADVQTAEAAEGASP